MAREIQCPCGHTVNFEGALAGRTICPICGRALTDPTPPAATVDAEAVPEKPSRLSLGPMIQAMLTPRAIHATLSLGGALSVLGLVVWLTSIGFFENKTVLAVALGTGSLALLASGWIVTLRTRYRLAGQALTFLACVVLPLNLWFYHAQNLVTLDHGLWIGGVVCCLLYAATVYLLADPLFLYAIEAGATLTVMLFLGQLHLATNTSYICMVLMALGLVSVHAERGFPPEAKKFDRRRFGMPLFWSGQVQAAAALLLLLSVQFADWLLGPMHALFGREWLDASLTQISQSAGGLLPHSYLLAAGIWLAGVYLYLYSDLIVRRIGIYMHAAAFALMMAEVTLVGAKLPTEALMAVLALTAMAMNISAVAIGRGRDGINDNVRRAVPRLSLALATLPVCIGLMLNLRATNSGAAEMFGAYSTTWLFVGAMSVVAVANAASAFIVDRSHARLAVVYHLLSGIALLVAATVSLRLAGLTAGIQQAAGLMIVPAGYLVAGRLLRRRRYETPFSCVAYAAASIVVLLGLTSAAAIDRFFVPLHGNSTTFWIGLLLAEAAVFYSVAAVFQRRIAVALVATGAASASLWQWLAYWNVPTEAHTMIFAGLGIGFLAISRLLGARPGSRTSESDEPPLAGHGVPLFYCASAILSLTLLAAAMQGIMGLPALNDGTASWLHVWSLVATAAAGGFAFLLAPTANWRRAYAVMTIALGSITALTISELSRLTPWQKLEVFLTVVGVLLVVASYIGRFRERDQQRDEQVTFGLWLGSMFAVVPLAIAVVYHRSIDGWISLPDEFGLLTISTLLLLTGFVWQVKSTTLFGGGGLVAYLAVLVVSLGWQPQVAIGVYLAIGGAAPFGLGIGLSVYREKLLEIPEKIANREGILRVINWR